MTMKRKLLNIVTSIVLLSLSSFANASVYLIKQTVTSSFYTIPYGNYMCDYAYWRVDSYWSDGSHTNEYYVQEMECK